MPGILIVDKFMHNLARNVERKKMLVDYEERRFFSKIYKIIFLFCLFSLESKCAKI